MKRREAKTNRVIGRRLREARLARGLSLKEVGKALDVAYQGVQRYESGETAVSAAKLGVLAELLEVRLDYFFEKGGKRRQDSRASRYRLMLMMRKLRELEKSDPERFDAIRELLGPLINAP
jgi:transcriptional regulator with XRE-family HTH domain